MQNIIGQHTGIMPLIENIKFCQIATQIQDILAQTPLLRGADRAYLDSQLVTWYENLPWILRSTEPCPESLNIARCIMKWRYQNLRIVLLRPVLLNLANRGNQGAPPAPEELAAVAKCRAIARQTIEDIAGEWTRNQMLGWNGVWLIYQASMIPLVSIFWEPWNTAQVRDCQAQIEVVLEAFDGMSDWSLAARRSHEVVLKMYEASKRPLTQLPSPQLDPKGHPIHMDGNGNGMNGNGTSIHRHHNNTMLDNDQMAQIEMMNQEGLLMLDHDGVWDLDGMLWVNLPEGLDMPFDGMPSMEFDEMGGMGGFEGGGFMMQ